MEQNIKQTNIDNDTIFDPKEVTQYSYKQKVINVPPIPDTTKQETDKDGGNNNNR